MVELGEKSVDRFETRSYRLYLDFAGVTRESPQLPAMKQPGGDDAGSGSGVVLLSGECRPLRRALRPLVWVVLEEVALDAVVEDGRLVARTSARHVAERLGVNPSTAAEALRVLRERGLVRSRAREGSGGPFRSVGLPVPPAAGLCGRPTMYGGAIHGVTVHGGAEHGWTPGGFAVCGRIKCGIVEVRDRRTWSGQPPAVGETPVRRPIRTALTPPTERFARSSGRSTAPPGSSRQCPGQTALDLGLGSS